ncbi:MAG: 50S ribosomal protein L19 [candidate division WOR-3 bacterium]|uniref:Large ribosomal subunit protein bL19 n=1 Tax=candidate division WOR-3 bacterium TaxID=2052148 RepID=A0A7V3ZTX7_UNCW3
MSNQKIIEIEKEYLKKDLPEFGPGDLIRVYMKIKELAEDKKTKKLVEKIRIQPFEGIVIKRKGSGLSETFTLRKVTQGIGIEKTFPLHSPLIEKIEVKRKGKVRRAKLYYLREKIGKKAKIKEKRD